MNLIKELGAPYVNEMYQGSYFLHEGTPYIFAKAGATMVQAHKLVGRDWKPAMLVPDDFPDMAKFGWPMLGYRNLKYRDHTIAIEVNALRSAKRGLRATLLKSEFTPTTALLANTDDIYNILEDGVTLLKEVLVPTYYTLPRAIAQVMDGKAIGCAVNANLAVEINPFSETPNDLSVLWRGTKIGTVNEHGTLSVPSRIAMRIPR